ncbi:MAG: hypothetical protein LBQ75_04845 [Zoogloeaceae bacterium]|nr:hypothetical protein [Zoogloeaceae bacterium]
MKRNLMDFFLPCRKWLIVALLVTNLSGCASFRGHDRGYETFKVTMASLALPLIPVMIVVQLTGNILLALGVEETVTFRRVVMAPLWVPVVAVWVPLLAVVTVVEGTANTLEKIAETPGRIKEKRAKQATLRKNRAAPSR